ncbi:MAG: 16S rRNA (guanine(966)-N(2))-methyltransferase RsmD [Alphaproteobacteria bacterium]|jgi:16S rRNA (guanine966-N2)-methyltransferase|nr:16S rRNA (guanine(966)-N(2))-methyltransferase RsmD [Rhodospirillaceae bacterium]MDP6430411.1 16S rRNA (guanine(966)-N(2))-methyltransferase RsmD [Rhodospirillales bacterium]MDP6642686.1 16S rRNA (guanine(966)-N(2))-methyltransferase RsmD [Rhodospirillales bacterium]MDP6819139.1 16S rRNA (guanine(966)-N(2))-methyltransferase RsmD [Alphaproteobacteria bacterium]
MRIVGGKNKGQRLAALKGAATRPTSDRIREALFNILAHGIGLELEGCAVLDAFAGTGALGLEALSRGAASALFIDYSEAALDQVRENAEALNEDAVVAMRADIRKLGPPPAGMAPAGLVFLDPPYGEALIGAALGVLAGPGWLADGAVLVAETGKSEDIEVPEKFVVIDERGYGSTNIMFLRYSA